MVPILSTHTWTSLSQEQRARIRNIFSIPRSSHVEVSDGRVITDGTTHKDFEHLTVDKMKEYLKSDIDDFHALFDLVIARIQDEIEGRPINESVIVTTEPLTVVIPPKAKKESKKERNAKK